MNVLSLFDGCSGGQQALERAGIKYNKYYASEIDKYAIKVTQHNYPGTIQLGSVLDIDVTKLEPIDLLIGGSPCTNLSFAGKRNGMITSCNEEIYTLERYLELKADGFQFEGESYLFWEYMRILRDAKPKYFLLENVVMGDKWENILSDAIGVRAVQINSALVSAQNRKRLYWVGQIRERVYFSENYCYECSIKKYRQNENGGIQEKAQGEGVGEVLERTQIGHFDMQGMRERISKNRKEGNNENVLSRMSDNQQERKRQEQRPGEKINIYQEILQGTQNGDEEVSGRIQKNGCRERSNEKGGYEEGGAEKREIQNDERVEFAEKQEGYRNNKNIDAKTDMCCVWCGKELDHRPRLSFVEGWEKYEGKSPSSLSKMQFDEIRQNNGRIYDFIPVGVRGVDTLFGETINPIPQPEDRGILLKDILEDEVDEKYYLSDKAAAYLDRDEMNKRFMQSSNDDKSICVTANFHKGIPYNVLTDRDKSNCITSNYGNLDTRNYIKGQGQIIVAMRGRGENNEQTLEPQLSGKTNSLTSVQKDNLVMQLNPSTESGGEQPYQHNRCYDANGISPCLNTDVRSPAILIPESTSKGYVGIEPGECFDAENINSKTRRGRKMVNKSNCLMAKETDFMRYEGIEFRKNYAVTGDGYEQDNRVHYENGKSGTLDLKSKTRQKVLLNYEGSLTPDQLAKFNPDVDASKHNALTQAIGRGGSSSEYMDSVSKASSLSSRIRRLTPLEAERLQTMKDNFTAVVSDSQRYKMIGNGWNIETIAHIFSFIKDGKTR